MKLKLLTHLVTTGLLCLLLSSCAIPWENLTQNPRVPEVSQDTDTDAVSWYDATCTTTTDLRTAAEPAPVKENQSSTEDTNKTVAYYAANRDAFAKAEETFTKLARNITSGHAAEESAKQLTELLGSQRDLYARLLDELNPLVKDPDKAVLTINSNTTRLTKMNAAFTTRWSQIVYSVPIPNENTAKAVNNLKSCKGILSSNAPATSSQAPAPGFY